MHMYVTTKRIQGFQKVMESVVRLIQYRKGSLVTLQYMVKTTY